jgi:hypothetical protein
MDRRPLVIIGADDTRRISITRTTAHLASHSALEQHRRILIDEMQPFEHLHPALIIRKQLEVLVRERELELGQGGFDGLSLVEGFVLRGESALFSPATTVSLRSRYRTNDLIRQLL